MEKDVWFEKRDLDSDSSGDVFFVNTNTLDLLLTFDPNSKESSEQSAFQFRIRENVCELFRAVGQLKDQLVACGNNGVGSQ